MTDTSDLKLASSHYVGTLLRHAGRLGLDKADMLEGLDVPEGVLSSEVDRVDNEVVVRLLGKIWRELDDDSWGFDPQPTRSGSFALLCDYMITASTLGEFLRRGERLGKYLFGNGLGLGIEQYDGVVRVFTPCYVGEQDPERFLSEFWTLVWHRLPCWVIEERMVLREVGFPYSAPPHAHLYPELFQCEVRFEQDHHYLEFDHRYLRRPVVRTAKEMEQFARSAPRDFFALPSRQTSVRASIAAILRNHQRERDSFPSFDEICEQLCMSPPTVRTRLKEDGTSYQKIKDRIRRDIVIDLLANSDLSIADIAADVRFTEPAALTRAFKKWTGLSPQEYRKKLVK